jgi:hypothetical protein
MRSKQPVDQQSTDKLRRDGFRHHVPNPSERVENAWNIINQQRFLRREGLVSLRSTWLFVEKIVWHATTPSRHGRMIRDQR